MPIDSSATSTAGTIACNSRSFRSTTVTTGASIATYAAISGIPCRIYVPAAAPPGKLVQIGLGERSAPENYLGATI